MSTRLAKELVGVALGVPLVAAFVVEGLHPAIRRPATKRRPSHLIKHASNSWFSVWRSGVSASKRALLIIDMMILFLSENNLYGRARAMCSLEGILPKNSPTIARW
jgi:hypothetical protein